MYNALMEGSTVSTLLKNPAWSELRKYFEAKYNGGEEFTYDDLDFMSRVQRVLHDSRVPWQSPILSVEESIKALERTF
jgi:hypothetical protein